MEAMKIRNLIMGFFVLPSILACAQASPVASSPLATRAYVDARDTSIKSEVANQLNYQIPGLVSDEVGRVLPTLVPDSIVITNTVSNTVYQTVSVTNTIYEYTNIYNRIYTENVISNKETVVTQYTGTVNWQTNNIIDKLVMTNILYEIATNIVVTNYSDVTVNIVTNEHINITSTNIVNVPGGRYENLFATNATIQNLNVDNIEAKFFTYSQLEVTDLNVEEDLTVNGLLSIPDYTKGLQIGTRRPNLIKLQDGDITMYGTLYGSAFDFNNGEMFYDSDSGLVVDNALDVVGDTTLEGNLSVPNGRIDANILQVKRFISTDTAGFTVPYGSLNASNITTRSISHYASPSSAIELNSPLNANRDVRVKGDLTVDGDIHATLNLQDPVLSGVVSNTGSFYNGNIFRSLGEISSLYGIRSSVYRSDGGISMYTSGGEGFLFSGSSVDFDGATTVDATDAHLRVGSLTVNPGDITAYGNINLSGSLMMNGDVDIAQDINERISITFPYGKSINTYSNRLNVINTDIILTGGEVGYGNIKTAGTIEGGVIKSSKIDSTSGVSTKTVEADDVYAVNIHATNINAETGLTISDAGINIGRTVNNITLNSEGLKIKNGGNIHNADEYRLGRGGYVKTDSIMTFDPGTENRFAGKIVADNGIVVTNELHATSNIVVGALKTVRIEDGSISCASNITTESAFVRSLRAVGTTVNFGVNAGYVTAQGMTSGTNVVEGYQGIKGEFVLNAETHLNNTLPAPGQIKPMVWAYVSKYGTAASVTKTPFIVKLEPYYNSSGTQVEDAYVPVFYSRHKWIFDSDGNVTPNPNGHYYAPGEEPSMDEIIKDLIDRITYVTNIVNGASN